MKLVLICLFLSSCAAYDYKVKGYYQPTQKEREKCIVDEYDRYYQLHEHEIDRTGRRY